MKLNIFEQKQLTQINKTDKLLKEGLGNLSAPWLVSSAFVCLVALLILVTFIGEAVREAFDPKKFTYYK